MSSTKKNCEKTKKVVASLPAFAKVGFVMTTTTQQRIIDLVIEQIREDFSAGDLTALNELLAVLPENILENYLSDEKLG